MTEFNAEIIKAEVKAEVEAEIKERIAIGIKKGIQEKADTSRTAHDKFQINNAKIAKERRLIK